MRQSLLRMVVQRLLWLVPTVVVILGLTYTLFFMVPADPAVAAMPRGASPETLAEVRARMGLDLPVWRQYLNTLHGPDLIGNGQPSGLLNWPPNLGYSFKNQEPVLDMVLGRLPVTLSLAAGGAVLWLLLGLGVGVLSALKPRSLRDRAFMITALIGVSTPQFVLGIAMIYVLYFKLGWFPAPGYTPITEDPVEWAHRLLLPWLTLAFTYAAAYSRILRSSMLEVAGENHVVLARAKGLSRRRVVGRHVIRPALLPVVTMLGMDIGLVLSGSVVVEIVFGLNGVGSLAVQALATADLPVLAGTVVLAAVSVVIFNLVVDIAYHVLDPRVG